MAGEGVFPKLDNDYLYGSDVNYATGIYTTLAGESITVGNVCYLRLSDGKAYVSDKSNDADNRASGIALNSASTSNAVYILTRGTYKTTGLAAQEQYFLSTSGGLTTTPNSVFIGFAQSTTELFLDIRDESTYTYVETITAPSGQQNLTSSTLFGNYEYKVFAHIVTPSASAGTISLFINGDTTQTNYYSGFIKVVGTTVTGNCQVNSACVSSDITNTDIVSINLDLGVMVSKASAQFKVESVNVVSTGYVRSSGTVSEITGFQLNHSNAAGMDTGSFMTIYKRKRTY